MSSTTQTPPPRRLLGSFIRAHRERLPAPKSGARRRTPGWRREELADAAQIGVTWLTWLEQGREVNASAAALDRLATALQLSDAERDSLFELAGRRDPQHRVTTLAPLPDTLRALPSQMRCPAYLLDAHWCAQAWNAAAAKLFVGWLDGPRTTSRKPRDRHLLHYVFLNPQAQTLIADWRDRSQRLVAEFHADFNRRPNDPALLAQIEALQAHSPWFAQCWARQDVLHRDGGERLFNHPAHGPLRYQQSTLLVAAQPEVKLVCLVPA